MFQNQPQSDGARGFCSCSCSYFSVGWSEICFVTSYGRGFGIETGSNCDSNFYVLLLLLLLWVHRGVPHGRESGCGLD